MIDQQPSEPPHVDALDRFTGLLGIGGDDRSDRGGLHGAIIGAVIVVAVASWLLRRTGRAI